MRTVSIALVMIFCQSVGLCETLWPEAASKYLSSLDCDFSAYTIYIGPDAAGILVKGQAKSIALCANTHEENGALKNKFCWLRSVDMKQGVYTSKDKLGSAWREESTLCSKEILIKIFNKATVKGQVQFKAFNSEWRVVTDKFGVAQSFLSLVLKEKKR